MALMDYIASLLPAYESIGLWGYWVIFLISFLESVVFLGAVVPGTLLILFAGFASAQGILDISDLIWFAAIGASLGDVVSFYLGNKGVRFLMLKISSCVLVKSFLRRTAAKVSYWENLAGRCGLWCRLWPDCRTCP